MNVDPGALNILLALGGAVGGAVMGAGVTAFRWGARIGRFDERQKQMAEKLNSMGRKVDTIHADLFGNGKEPKFVRTTTLRAIEGSVARTLDRLGDRVTAVEQNQRRGGESDPAQH